MSLTQTIVLIIPALATLTLFLVMLNRQALFAQPATAAVTLRLLRWVIVAAFASLTLIAIGTQLALLHVILPF